MQESKTTTRKVWRRNLFGRWEVIRETSDLFWMIRNQHRYVFTGNGVHAPAHLFDDFMKKVPNV